MEMAINTLFFEQSLQVCPAITPKRSHGWEGVLAPGWASDSLQVHFSIAKLDETHTKEISFGSGHRMSPGRFPEKSVDAGTA